MKRQTARRAETGMKTRQADTQTDGRTGTHQQNGRRRLRQTTHLSDSCIIKVDPCFEFGMEDESGVVFPVVTHHRHQLQSRQFADVWHYTVVPVSYTHLTLPTSSYV